MERLLNFCSCRVCSNHSQIHWMRLGGIELKLHCKHHHNWGLSSSDRRSTNYILFLAANMYCKGNSLHLLRTTCHQRNTWRAVLPLSVGNAFWYWNGFVGRKISDIIGWWRFRWRVRFEYLGWGHERIPEMSFSLYKDRADSFVVGSLPEYWSHDNIMI